MYLDGFGKFLVIFVQKKIITLVKKKLDIFFFFLVISKKKKKKKKIHSQKSDYLNRLLVKFLF